MLRPLPEMVNRPRLTRVAKLTRAETARIKGTSRAAVTQAVKRGRLVSGSDKSIDTNHPTNRKYLKRPPADGGKRGRSRPKLGVDSVVAKAIVDRRLKELQCQKLEIDNAVKRKELAPVLSVTRTMADLGGILGVHFLHLPRRMVAQVVAMVKRGDPEQDIEQFIRGEISRGIENFKKAAVAKFTEHVKEMDEEAEGAGKK